MNFGPRLSAAGAAILALALAAGGAPARAAGPYLNGFDLSGAIIPINEIERGGPPRDGIPSIDQPRFLSASEAAFMSDNDLVISLQRDSLARAYPLRILVWHEIVNDRFGGESVVITYCPLCGTSVVFDAQVDGRTSSFGVSGLLYRSDVLMYDRETGSLWSQLAFKAVTGPHAGKELRWLPSQILTWKAWKQKFPSGEVLSTQTGFNRNYNVNPYAGYELSPNVWFSVPMRRHDYPTKTWILGILHQGRAKAYALQELPAHTWIRDSHESMDLEVFYDPTGAGASVINRSTGQPVPFTLAYWFAWQAFYPETKVWRGVRVEIDRALQPVVTGETGRTYALESSPDLVSWRPLTNVTILDRSIRTGARPRDAVQEFYRARLVP